ncbi:ABC transporter permease [Oceanobacillus rekensis]|uniref:ABC transporter permease n=1 Tax=Oceanobacillus rekensis TaxID=937927 RepID=UPI000B4525CC|nr:ABC transporter permease subunit [Oceanobacillus rekensis]
MQWTTLFKKEMVESWRNKKLIWLPLVMILLAIMDPISNYYMPQIIEAVGGLPDGATFELPDFTPAEVVMMSLSQFSTLGVLIVVLVSMGTIAGERKSGISELVLVKPVSYGNYITAKWAALLLLVWISFFLGMLASWYYINILYGDLSFGSFSRIIFFYGLWLMFVVTLSIFFNSMIKTSGLVAFFTIATIMLMRVVTEVFNHILEWSPNNLSNYILEMLLTESIPSNLIGTAIITIIITATLLIVSINTFKSKELAN